MFGGRPIDLHHAAIGQYQLRALMPGIDPLRLAAAENQALAVHDIDVMGQDRHGAIDDILRQLMIQLEHGANFLENDGLFIGTAQ